MQPAGADPAEGRGSGEREGAPATAVQRGDLLLYALVAALLLVGWAGPALWRARDPRIEVWAAWHEARREPTDPWGTPFRESEAGICSAGPNGAFEAPGAPGDDVWVPRVPPAELGAFRLLGWLPWLAAIGLAFGWEALRWLRRPSQGLTSELPLALGGGTACGLAAWGGLTLLASRERSVSELVDRVAGGLFVPPALALGGSVALCASLALLAIRLRAAPLDGHDPAERAA